MANKYACHSKEKETKGPGGGVEFCKELLPAGHTGYEN